MGEAEPASAEVGRAGSLRQMDSPGPRPGDGLGASISGPIAPSLAVSLATLPPPLGEEPNPALDRSASGVEGSGVRAASARSAMTFCSRSRKTSALPAAGTRWWLPESVRPQVLASSCSCLYDMAPTVSGPAAASGSAIFGARLRYRADR